MNVHLLVLLVPFLVPNVPVHLLPSVLQTQSVAIQPVSDEAAIMPFDNARDINELTEIFDADRQWFTKDFSYSIAETIAADAQRSGCLHIAVLRQRDALIGFVIYKYVALLRAGFIECLGINKDYRGKRYGAKLLAHASEKMQKMGAQKIVLVMYTGNEAAQKLYTRFGFCETYRDSDGVVFEYKGSLHFRDLLKRLLIMLRLI